MVLLLYALYPIINLTTDICSLELTVCRTQYRESNVVKSFGLVELRTGQHLDTIAGLTSLSSFFAPTMERPGCSVSTQ